MKMHGRIIGSVLAGACLLLGAESARAALMLHYDSPTYSVSPGGTFTVQVLYDADPSTAGDQPVSGGLFSEGVKTLFPAADASVLSTDDFVLPPALNSNGVGGPAAKSVGAGYVGGAGAEDLSATSGYMGTLLATVTIQDLAPAGTYTLSLDKYYSNEANFVSYADGSTLDSQLSFGTATVTVTGSAVPEPATVSMFAIGTLAGLIRRRRLVLP